MPQDSRDLLALYQPWRRTFEIGFWIVFFCSQAVVNSIIVLLDVDRAHLDFASWEPISWEWTSNLVILALIPALLTFERRFPLHFGSLRRQLPKHLLASMAFCLLHVLGMVGLRKLIYLSQGGYYDFGFWPRELGYEYLKDARSYGFVLLAVACYRLLLLRLQGEASLLTVPDSGPSVEPVERPNRFLVKKLGKEFLLPAQEIEWLQAWGNYVNLRVRGHDYPLRSTMTAIEARLDPERFVRVHRSHIVNIHEVAEIEPLESGDARIRLRDGSLVPCSRTYRDALKAGAAS